MKRHGDKLRRIMQLVRQLQQVAQAHPWAAAAAAGALALAVRATVPMILKVVRGIVFHLTVLGRPVRKDFLGQQGRTSSRASHPLVSNPRSFEDLGAVLPRWLMRALEQHGFSNLRPIQKKVLPLALAGEDIVGIAPTGSGKTLAFLVPGIVHAAAQETPRRASEGPIVLILAPTRELVVQINAVAEQLLYPSRDRADGARCPMSAIALYGGSPKIQQLQALRKQRQLHVMAATPGRLLDFLRNEHVFKLRLVSFFVLDEGDRMLDLGFEEDVLAISSEIRRDRQMLFFSATWPREVEEAAQRLCRSPAAAKRVHAGPWTAGEGCDAEDTAEASNERSDFGSLAMPPKEIRQIVEVVSRTSVWETSGPWRRKLELVLMHLEPLLGDGTTQGKALIFTQTRNSAELLGVEVADHFGLNRCGVMHGLHKQDRREQTLEAFRRGQLRALVATDVLGRGVDIPGVTHVIIFDFPEDIETYVHRVGRTGRNGQRGTAIALFEPKPWAPGLTGELIAVLQACDQQVPKSLLEEHSRQEGPLSSGTLGVQAGPRQAPRLDSASPDLASDTELRLWAFNGERVWSYSANGGRSEQGRIEFRSGGQLRTTWGWGTWQLLPREEVDGELVQHMAITWSGTTDVIALDASGVGFELVSRNGRPASACKQKTVGKLLPGESL